MMWCAVYIISLVLPEYMSILCFKEHLTVLSSHLPLSLGLCVIRYDSRVKAMELDERPTEQYSDIGGLDKQIEEVTITSLSPVL